MPTLADQIAPQPQKPTGLGGWLASIGDEMAGAFARYGRRSGAQRDASLALLNQASDPNTDPIMGAGMKALGLAGLITHPLAFFPTREEWDQRLEAAGNDGRFSRSIGGFLSDLPSLIDPQMAAGGAATVAPAIFAGMMAKTADLNKLKQAEKLAELGHSADDIRDMTGLHKGLDGKWRSEISDSAARLTPGVIPPGMTVKVGKDGMAKLGNRTLGETLDHPPLFDAYPDLRDVEIRGMRSFGGMYEEPSVSMSGRETISVGADNPKDTLSNVLHEIQHAIAKREGFSPGAAYVEGGGSDAWDRYFRDAGEVEPRNVQARMGMTAEELAMEQNAPWRTQDVPYSQQILSQGGGTPSSVTRDQALGNLTGGGSVQPVKATSAVDEYAMSHRPPMRNSGAPGHDVTGGGDYYPDDVYSNKAIQYYGTGNHAMDAQTMNIVQQMRGKPNATVTIYRAVPHTATRDEQIFKLESDMKKYMARGKVPAGATKTGSDWYNAAWNDLQGLKSLPDTVPEGVQINPGDWVTINRAYAKEHGESSLRGGYKIISKKVKVKDIFTNGDSIHEWGYDPE